MKAVNLIPAEDRRGAALGIWSGISGTGVALGPGVGRSDAGAVAAGTRKISIPPNRRISAAAARTPGTARAAASSSVASAASAGRRPWRGDATRSHQDSAGAGAAAIRASTSRRSSSGGA